jgi:hypothetical protein
MKNLIVRFLLLFVLVFSTIDCSLNNFTSKEKFQIYRKQDQSYSIKINHHHKHQSLQLSDRAKLSQNSLFKQKQKHQEDLDNEFQRKKSSELKHLSAERLIVHFLNKNRRFLTQLNLLARKYTPTFLNRFDTGRPSFGKLVESLIRAHIDMRTQICDAYDEGDLVENLGESLFDMLAKIYMKRKKTARTTTSTKHRRKSFEEFLSSTGDDTNLAFANNMEMADMCTL